MSTHDHDHDDMVQCDHSKGLAKAKESGNLDDPMMEQSEWSLQDWNHIYGQAPVSPKKGAPTAELVKHVTDLLPSEPARVLLPLCGKSPDLRWLYERGNSVVGLEGVEKPVEEFFNLYPDLAHCITELPYGKLYKSQDERLQIYVCDVLAVPSGALGKFDAVFDWGAYTAIRPADRPKYSEVVMDAVKDDTRYFLEVCHDAPPDSLGLPHSVPFRTVKLELGVGKKMTVLGTLDVSEEWGVETFFDSHILFTPPE